MITEYSKMKILIILLLMFTVNLAEGQDYQNICSEGTTLFKSPASFLKAFRRDSLYLSGSNDTTFLSYRTILPIPNSYCYDTNGGSILGRKIIKNYNGWFNFFNRANDTIYLNCQGGPGSTWKFMNLPNGCYLHAQITSIISDTVLGMIDSVKVITLQAKDQNNINIQHIFNQKQIKLSKNYGLSKMFDAYLMPNDTLPFLLAGKSSVMLGIQNLHWKEIYDFDTGDVFHYFGTINMVGNGGNWSKIYRVLSKTTYGNNDSVEYTMEYCNHTFVGVPPQYIDTFDTIAVKYNWLSLTSNNPWVNSLPEEFTPTGDFSAKFYQNINQFNGRHMKGTVRNRYVFSPDDNCWIWFIGNHTPYYTNNYVKGLGLTYSGVYVIPDYTPEYSTENLVYFKKGSEIWGTPVSADCHTLVHVNDLNPVPAAKVTIFPNPVTTVATIYVENLDLRTEPEIIMNDMLGRTVFRSGIQNKLTHFNRNEIQNGAYILFIANRREIICKPIVLVLN